MDHIALIAWQVVGCLLLADFITGFVHWVEDCYGLPSWPLIGKSVIEPNMLHHKHPTWMITMGSLFGRNIQPIASFIVISIVAWFVCRLFELSIPWQFYATAAFASIGNEVHSWSHGGGRNIRIVKFLQDAAIIITPYNHNHIHHRAPYDKGYCALTNIVNPILDGLKFWRALEWSIGLVGIKPKRMTAARDYV